MSFAIQVEPSFFNLPTEILIGIYCRLPSFSDVFHFAAPNNSAQQTTFPHGPLRAMNPAGLTQMSSQATAPAQQGNATQSSSQVYGQSGPLHMFTQPPVARSQAGTESTSLWPGPSQEEHMPGNENFQLGDLPSVFQ